MRWMTRRETSAMPYPMAIPSPPLPCMPTGEGGPPAPAPAPASPQSVTTTTLSSSDATTRAPAPSSRWSASAERAEGSTTREGPAENGFKTSGGGHLTQETSDGKCVEGRFEQVVARRTTRRFLRRRVRPAATMMDGATPATVPVPRPSRLAVGAAPYQFPLGASNRA